MSQPPEQLNDYWPPPKPEQWAGPPQGQVGQGYGPDHPPYVSPDDVKPRPWPEVPPKKKHTGLIIAAIVGAFVLFLLMISGCVAAVASLGSSTDTVQHVSAPSAPAATPTCYQYSEPYCDTEEPADEPSTEWSTTKADWSVKLKIRSKKCYGYGVGCNVEVMPKFSYFGDNIPEDTTISITYKIHGGEDGTITDTVDLDDQGKYSTYPEVISTRSSSTKLTVRIVKVEVS